MKIHYMIWLTISALVFAFGEYLSKKFALSPKVSYVVLILVTYSIATLLRLPAILQKNQLSIVGTIWSVLSLLATVLIGLLLFHEHLSMWGMLGIITAITSIIFLSLA